MFRAELDALGLALRDQDLVDPLLAGSGDLLRNVCLHVGTKVHLWTLKDQMPLAGHMRSLAWGGWLIYTTSHSRSYLLGSFSYLLVSTIT